MESTVLLSTSYFGPVQYFSKFLLYPGRIMERFDHYTRQSYRNRCYIYGANGLLALSIPVRKGPAQKTPVRDIRIDYGKNWRKLHWKGIESAYRHSPFFEFYMDDVRRFLEGSHEFLLDLNLEILDYLLDALEIEGGYALSDRFNPPGNGFSTDCRELIHPKRDCTEDPEFIAEPYAQVFQQQHGFLPNMSIMDLLFNEGPLARTVLEKCLRR